MFKFESDPQEFLTQWRNGNAFTTDDTVVSYRLRGNVGDLVQMRQQITVECSVNESLSLEFTYDSTLTRIICNGLNFRGEGLFVGATVQIIQGTNEGESTITNITGRGFGVITLDTTNLGFLVDGTHTDIWIRVKDAPTYMRYQYGTIPTTVKTESDDVWNSPIDGNTQAYYKYDIIQPSYELFTMQRFGPFKTWDLSESIQVAYDGTVDEYYHTYDIIHTFRICPYVETEINNIINKIPTDALSRTSTLKYANKIFVGYDSEVVGSVTDLGVDGDVGYYNENYNGKESVYAVESVTITNPSGQTVLSVTETNSVTIKVTNSDNRFVSAQKFVLSIFRLAKSGEVTNNRDYTFAQVYGFDSVRQTSSAMDPPISSSPLEGVDATFIDDEEIDVTFDVTFTTDQQSHIKPDDIYVIVVATGETGRGPDLEDNVSVIATVNTFYKDEDLSDLIYDVDYSYFDSNGALDGDRAYTNQATWNGCFVGFDILFKMLQPDDTSFNRVMKVVSRLVLVNDTDVNDVRELWKKDMPLNLVGSNDFVSGNYNYQIANGQSNDTTKLPTTEPLNINLVRSIPPYPADYQQFQVSGSIPRIPWRDWIANSNVPTENFDDAEPNNNLNQKTSNYASANGYSCFHEIYLEVNNTVLVEVSTLGKVPKLQEVTTTTPFHLRSDAFEIIDFDVDGNPSVAFSGEIKFYNVDGAEVQDVSTTAYRLVEVTITHDQGTLTLADLWAEIWIEPVNSTSEVFAQLHSEKDWSSETNALMGSQEVSPTNFNYVEIVSAANVVYLYCRVNENNMISGVDFNWYYRLGKITN